MLYLGIWNRLKSANGQRHVHVRDSLQQFDKCLTEKDCFGLVLLGQLKLLIHLVTQLVWPNNNNNNNNNQICKAPECQKTSVALADRNSRAKKDGRTLAREAYDLPGLVEVHFLSFLTYLTHF